MRASTLRVSGRRFYWALRIPSTSARTSSHWIDLLHFERVLPSQEYVQRRDARRSRVAHHEKIHIRLGNAALALAILVAIMAWSSFRGHHFSPWWLAAPVAAFVVTADYHSRVLRARELAQRAVEFYEQGLARVEDRWIGVGEMGERFNDPHHVYAADLDLYGKGSLFQLLSTARTRMGEDALAQWLLAPATVPQIQERHGAVSELRDQLDLREDLAVIGEDVGVGVHPEALLKWAQSPALMKPSWIRSLSPLLAVLAIAAALVWAVWGTATPLILIVVIEAVLTYWLKKPLEEVLRGTENAFRNLELFSGVLARVEAHKFQAPLLHALRSELMSGGFPSSRAIARLRTLGDRINSRHNIFVRIIAVRCDRGCMPSDRWKLFFRWQLTVSSILPIRFQILPMVQHLSTQKSLGIRSYRQQPAFATM